MAFIDAGSGEIKADAALLQQVDAVPGQPVLVPEDVHLGDAMFSRSGSDLTIESPDGAAVVVRDFYATDTAPQLLFDGGAKQISGELASHLAGGLAPGQVAQLSSGAELQPIGLVETVVGEATAVRTDGTRVQLNEGDTVYQGDILETGAEGGVGVVLADETAFSMAADGRMVLDEMIYDPGNHDGSLAISVLEGVFTFVSGNIAKADPDAMVLETPVATIGIRGTQTGIDLGRGEKLDIVAMEEGDGFIGEIIITTNGGTVTLNLGNQTIRVSDINQSPSDPVFLSPQQIADSYGDALSVMPPSSGVNRYGVEPATGKSDDEESEEAAEEALEEAGDTAAGGEGEIAPDGGLLPLAGEGLAGPLGPTILAGGIPLVTPAPVTTTTGQSSSSDSSSSDSTPEEPVLELPEPTAPPSGGTSGSGSGVLVDTDVHEYYFSVTASGSVTIHVSETVDDDSDFDSQINLYFDDGSLDIEDFIENDDDDGGGPSGLESMIVRNLDAGDYLLRIGTHSFNSSDLGATNPNGHHDGTDYTLSITGDFVVASFGSQDNGYSVTEDQSGENNIVFET